MLQSTYISENLRLLIIVRAYLYSLSICLLLEQIKVVQSININLIIDNVIATAFYSNFIYSHDNRNTLVECTELLQRKQFTS